MEIILLCWCPGSYFSADMLFRGDILLPLIFQKVLSLMVFTAFRLFGVYIFFICSPFRKKASYLRHFSGHNEKKLKKIMRSYTMY